MSNNESLTAKLDVIKAIPDDRIQSPGSMPVMVYIQEAEYLHKWCQPDKAKLVANHLQWEIVEDIPARAKALKDAQSMWAVSDASDAEVEKQWNEKLPEAVKLKKHIVRSMKFSFNRNAPIIAKLNRLSRGSSNTALIQSLNDIAAFGMEHIELLKSENFDVSLLDSAASMSDLLGDLQSSVKTKRAYCSESRTLRDQAFTHLKEAVDELKRHADFVLWQQPDRLKGYASEYNRKRYLKTKNRTEIEEVQQDLSEE